MGKCELLFVQHLQLVVAHHSQAFNKAFNKKSHFVVVFMFYNTKVRIVYYIICCIAYNFMKGLNT